MEYCAKCSLDMLLKAGLANGQVGRRVQALVGWPACQFTHCCPRQGLGQAGACWCCCTSGKTFRHMEGLLAPDNHPPALTACPPLLADGQAAELAPPAEHGAGWG